MHVNIGIVMDPIDRIQYKKDTSLALLWAARDKGWTLWYMEDADLYQGEGTARARMAPIEVFEDPARWYALGEAEDRPLSDLDVILMRKDPPFDNAFVYATYLLEQAERDGVLVVNKPASLRDCNEKFFATLFPECTPPVTVARRAEHIKAFVNTQEDCILKPLDGMGGSAIFRLKKNDPNMNVVIETLTQHGRCHIMAQRFIPEIRDGDKRIILIDGEPIPYCLARYAAEGETRANLAAGGTGRARALSERDLWLCQQVAPELKKRGLIFVGLDVIGDYITEINVTSPTGIREINAQFDQNIGGALMDCIEGKLGR
jgi:glutathione synthase